MKKKIKEAFLENSKLISLSLMAIKLMKHYNYKEIRTEQVREENRWQKINK